MSEVDASAGKTAHAGAKRRTYAHELRAGDEYAPLTFIVTPELNQQFLYALEDFHPDYVAPGETAFVHPVVLLHMSARTRSPSFVMSPQMGSVFAKDIVKFLAPAHVGDTLHVSWRIMDVYEKRGRLYQAMSTRIRGQRSGEVLAREAHSVFFVGGNTASSSGRAQ
ncbi:MAG: hypothetical protein AB7O44_24265 [Hyphomicrobiaceae bacterium]